MWWLWRLYKLATDVTSTDRKADALAVTTVCLGLLTVGIVGWYLAGFAFEPWAIRATFVPIPLVAGTWVFVSRLARPFRGRAAIPPECCTRCRAAETLTPARYLRHAGQGLPFVSYERSGFFCRRCHVQTAAWWTFSTFVVGWWGVLSLFIAPAVILHNLLFLLRGRVSWTRDRRYAEKQVIVVLEGEIDYVRNLMATKDVATVAEVVGARLELPAGIVAEVLVRHWQAKSLDETTPGTPGATDNPYR